jgi:ubiquinone biosynthesis protein COQ9
MLLDSFENKEKILEKFLEIAALDGWNQESLLKALAELEIKSEFCDLIFENGLLDLNNFYIDSYNKKSAKLAGNLENKKIREKITELLFARFEVEKNNQIALQRLVNFYLNPKNFLAFELGPRPLFYALKDCYKISDFIWKSIKDSSTDFNFYTKRLTLAKIILRSFFVFVKDDSENLAKTKKIIDLEIAKIMQFEKFKSQAKGFASKHKEGIYEFVFNENGSLKSPKDLIKNLPFIRLIKK